jgi:hypothetical protein
MEKTTRTQPKNETFKALKEKLPYGFSRIVFDRLAARGVKTSLRNIQSVANGHNTSRDGEIEKELLKLIDEPQPEKKSDFELEIERKLKIGE